MSIKSSFSHPLAVAQAVAATLLLLGFATAHAEDRTWANTGTDYNTSANWTGGLPTATDAASFNSIATNQPNLSAPITNQQIRFAAPVGGGVWTLSGGSALTLTSTGTGTTAGTGSAIVSSIAGATNTISAPIILGNDSSTTATFYQTAGGTLAISGNISSANAITGLSLTTGTFTLSGNNTYNGTTTLASNAKVFINSATAISAGTLVVSGGTIDNTSAAAITLSNNNNINLSGGNLTFTGTKDLSFGSGTVSISGAANRTITTTAGTLTIGSINADTTARTFRKAGAGTLVIQNAAGANFQGGFTLTTGMVQIGNNTALGSGGVTFTAGTLQAINSDITLANTSTLTALTISGTQSLTLNGKLTGATGGNRTLTSSITPGGSAKLLTLGDVDISNDTGATARTLTIAGTGNTTIGGTIANGAGTTTANRLTISNTGTTTLAGNSTYTGATTVSAGTLEIASTGRLGGGSYAGSITNTGTFIYSGANEQTLSGVISGAGAFTQNGTGTLTLTGSNTYTGNTTVSAGTLNVNGSISASSRFTVASGATLGGNGSISGAVSIASGGTLAPGNSPGIMSTGNLSLAEGSSLSAEITGSGTVAGTDYDQVNVTGTVSLLGNLTLTLTSYTPTPGQLIFLINNDLTDTITTGFANVNGGSLSNNTEFNLAGEGWFISYEADYNGGTGSAFTGGNDVALYAIPEPGTWALLAFSLATIIVLRRRRVRS